MAKFNRLQPRRRKYLLMPGMPTPNGSLHLGHLSGPYLKLDLLARAQRRNGSTASIMCGSDVYESFTCLKAWQTGLATETICAKYHTRIMDDLAALRIECDLFIDPLDDRYRDDFAAFQVEVVDDLIKKGVTEIRKETYRRAAETGDFLAGSWLTGTCPVCGAPGGSYQCEQCGTHYRPMDILHPRFKKGDATWQEIDDVALYLVISQPERLFGHLQRIGFPEELQDIIRTYFRRQGHRIRITNPDTWGIPYNVEGSKVPQVIYTFTALYFFSLYLGRLYAEKYNEPLHPFDRRSDVVTVASFGVDCCIPYTVSALGCGLESNSYKPMDFLLPNFFLQLEGHKFSTSRGHAIWGSDLIQRTPVSADAVRYFLAEKNPERSGQDFKVDEFIHTLNSELADRWQYLLAGAWAMLSDFSRNDPREPSDHSGRQLVEKLEDLLITQLDFLSPPGFDMKMSLYPLKEWIGWAETRGLDRQTAYWWLKGFALLAFPITPDCAAYIWRMLGYDADPVEADYFRIPPVNFCQAFPIFFRKISFEELRVVLPVTLMISGTE